MKSCRLPPTGTHDRSGALIDSRVLEEAGLVASYWE